VTLFASGDSATSARLVACWPEALRLSDCRDTLAPHVLMLERLLRAADQFDVVHFHVDALHLPLMRRANIPYVTTMHNRLDLPELQPLYEEFCDAPLVSISDAQRGPLPQADWAATVHHGLPESLLQPCEEPGDHVVFLGRVSRDKGLDRALEIARRAGLPLRVAAKIDPGDRAYFEREIGPQLARPGADYVGEITESQKAAFLGGARAVLFPIDWPEPFGLVMIEAIACGTPVIACRRGAVPEVIDDGVTGFIVDDVDQAVHALARVDTLDRRRIRDVFERRFSARRMAEDYLRVYEAVIERARGGDGDRAQAVA
jgi:glycosyltransferase involved in cell wall biosynthesis